jgi:hypothetical protein
VIRSVASQGSRVFATRWLIRAIGAALFILVAVRGFGAEEGKVAAKRVVIPFDFESKFDNGRYGQMVGDLIWKKLERDGTCIIPESMLDVRDWQERQRMVPNPDTPLAELQRYVRDDFGGQACIWGKIERAEGVATDEYDVWIRIADFSESEPRLVFSKQARTKTVSEIPHVYVKEALDQLLGRKTEAKSGPDPEVERLWQTAANLVKGDFEKGDPRPEGWDPPTEYVSKATVTGGDGIANHVIRFQFPSSVAETTGVLYYSDYFPVEANATYRFQCRWRTTGSAVKVFIKCYDELTTDYSKGRKEDSQREKREVYRSQQNLQGPAKTWNVQTEDFTPKHTQFTPKWGRVMLYAYFPPGTVDFDDVIVKQIKPAPASQTPRVRRPSLETKVLSDELEKPERSRSKQN